MNWGIYLAPSFFTICNLGFGLYSILWSVREKFTTAASLILIAIVFDGLDGFIARATKSTSKIGIELDSFADFVSFCIAPSMLMYQIILWKHRTPGLMVIFVYVVFGMLRLARFNVKAHEQESLSYRMVKTSYFEGLPVPAAAGLLSGLVLSFELFELFEQGITRKAIPILMGRIPFLFNSIPVLMIVLSFLMISKLRYTGFSRLQITKRVTLRTMVLVFTAILLVLAYPENMIFIIFLFYVISGLIDYLLRIYSLRRKKLTTQGKENVNG